MEADCQEKWIKYPYSTAPPAVSGALSSALENPGEAVLSSCQAVPISAAGLQGEQPLVIE